MVGATYNACPACDRSVVQGAWICPYCDHILDPSVLESSEAPEALILGEVSVDPEAFQVLAGESQDQEGKTHALLVYATGTSARFLAPDGVPLRTPQGRSVRANSSPTTPLDTLVLQLVDGRRTVRQIQRDAGGSSTAVSVTLLSLLDRGAIRIETTPPLLDGVPVAKPRKGRRKREETNLRREASVRPPITAPSTLLEPLPRPSMLDAHELARTRDDGPPIPPLPPIPRPPSRADEDSLGFVEPMAIGPEDLEEITENFHLPAPGAVSRSSPGISGRVEVPAPLAPSSRGPSVVPPPRGARPVAMLEQEDTPAALEPPAPRRSPVRALSAPPEATPLRMEALLDPSADDELGADDDLPAMTPQELEPIGGPHVLDRTPPPAPSRPPEVAEPRSAPEISSRLELRPPLLDVAFLERVDPSRVVSLAELREAEPPPARGAGLPTPEALAPPPPPLAPPPPAPELPRAPAEGSGRIRAGQAALRSPPEEARAEAAAEPVKAEAPRPDPPRPEPPKAEEPARRPEPPRRYDGPPASAANMAKAAKLFEQALKDKADGNVGSARMNMKLALTFDPSNGLYQEAYQDLGKQGGDTAGKKVAAARIRELYDKATLAERLGRFDEAIELLERAHEDGKDGAVMNRLGVLLAMRRGEFVRAQKLIEAALEQSPGNPTYSHNLSKVLQKAAAQSVTDRNKPPEKKTGGLLGMLRKK